MTSRAEAKLESIVRYPLLESVGGASSALVAAVDSWAAAVETCASRKWKTCRIMARNTLQRSVEERSWERSEDWNPVVRELRPHIRSFVASLLVRVPVGERYRKALGDDLTWDLLGMCLESNYADIVTPVFYVPHLEPWYAAGHFPCGWDGKVFPDRWDGTIRDGRLIVF